MSLLKTSIYLQLLIGIIFSYFNIYAGRVEPGLKWNTSQVKVCWGKESHLENTITELKLQKKQVYKVHYLFFSQEEKEQVRQFIKKHFSLKITGIEFSGWQDCTERSSNHVTLLGVSAILIKESFISSPYYYTPVTSHYEGRSSIGMRSFHNRTTWEKGKPGTQMLILKNLNLGTILHEFGHLAGLRHEHPRSLYENFKPQCQEYTSRDNLIIEESLSEKTTSYTRYDDFSVMNYCYLMNFDYYNKNLYPVHKLNFELPQKQYVTTSKDKTSFNYLLSIGDIHTLRCLYKKSSLNNCHEEYDPQDSIALNKIYTQYLQAL